MNEAITLTLTLWTISPINPSPKSHRNIAVTMASGVDNHSGQAVRRTWDLEEAERKYKERISREKEDSKDDKLKKTSSSIKLPPPAFTDPNSVQARPDGLINVQEYRGKRELAAPLQGRSRKGKSAGFYCEACDLTFKDNLSFLDHMNSSQRTLFHRFGGYI